MFIWNEFDSPNAKPPTEANIYASPHHYLKWLHHIQKDMTQIQQIQENVFSKNATTPGFVHHKLQEIGHVRSLNSRAFRTAKKSSPTITTSTSTTTSKVTNTDNSSQVSQHENSRRRDSVSSLLSSGGIESYFNEIKKLGRQVKRQLLEDEDIMSLDNKILPAVTSQLPPPTASSNSLDDVVVKQQEQLFSSFNKLKQAKQTLESSPSSETEALPLSIPVLKETKCTKTTAAETASSFPPPTNQRY